MKENIKKWLKPILFTAGGALVGLAYYYFVGCSTGACPLTSNPFITMAHIHSTVFIYPAILGGQAHTVKQNAIQHLGIGRNIPEPLVREQHLRNSIECE